MAVKVVADISGMKPLLAKLKKLSPKENRQILVRSLTDCAELVVENAKREQIIRGGRVAGTGPRGGKVMSDKPPHPSRLTSRTGRLRDSISINLQPLPGAIEVGASVVYARVHELGIPPYPKRAFLEPAVKATERRFPEIFMANWRRIAGV